MASELDLDAIEKRVDMVDAPPWLAVPVQYNVLGETITGFEVGHAARMSSAFCRDFDAAKFIREAIIDIPALVKRVRELERIVEESVVSGSELVVGQYVLIREKLAYDEYGYTATAINGTHRPTSLEPKLDLWEAAEQARRWSMFPPPDICAEKGLADGK